MGLPSVPAICAGGRGICGIRRDRERLPNGRHFAFGELLGKAPQVTKGACSRLGPTSSGSLTPTTLRGPAPNGHPCPDGALAASMRLGPLRVVCVRPAPKSRLVVSGLFAYEDQDQKQKQKPSFPAKAGPTNCTHCYLVGPASAGKRPVQALMFDRSHAPRGNASRDALRHSELLGGLIEFQRGPAICADGRTDLNRRRTRGVDQSLCVHVSPLRRHARDRPTPAHPQKTDHSGSRCLGGACS
jgi:hypothetical protein